MERLTARNSEGIGVLKQPFECERCGDLQWSLPDLGNGSPIDKLAEYEDLEEQGKLLKLPCTVGDIVYALLVFPASYNYVIRQAEVKEIQHGRYTRGNTIRYGLELISRRGRIFDFYGDDFNKTFFTAREEAEAALKELEGKKA